MHIGNMHIQLVRMWKDPCVDGLLGFHRRNWAVTALLGGRPLLEKAVNSIPYWKDAQLFLSLFLGFLAAMR